MNGNAFHSFYIEWVLDIGASHHMTPKVEILSNVEKLATPIFIAIPNGHTELVDKIEMIEVALGLAMKNTLHTLISPTFAATTYLLALSLRGLFLKLD